MYDTRQYLQMNARSINNPNHCQVPIRLVKSAKMHQFTANSFHNHTWKSDSTAGEF